MRFFDRVERGYNLLAEFASQTFTNLLVIFTVELAPFIEDHTFIVGDTFYFFRIIKSAKIYLRSIRNANDLFHAIFKSK